ncbi:hypothetical protein [Actinoplanes regularis]|uniref:Uncharacterized protein n=1 Tax=Actinoplanes regularis TaxID=52697 RepID=A0A238XHH6_9ACTN|nr:hypothetical protein [Actinoplanes regularis]GIE86784.1 hypothetical protein Are01nite_32640 [Actinoplanes regularis]SNR57794.1 hypothetical protein SAMN06264365_103412 [Actinoplanes regularis]
MVSDERLSEIVAKATAPRPPAPTREDFVNSTARRFDLTPEQAARIDAETPGDITRQARELRYQAALARATPEDGPVIRLALVPGHGVPDQAPENFDPDTIVRRLRAR